MASYKAFRQSGHIPTLFAAFLYFAFSFAVWVLKRSDGAVDLLQLVPLRWPATTAVAGSMIIEIGALGGSILPNLLGYRNNTPALMHLDSSSTPLWRYWSSLWCASSLGGGHAPGLAKAAVPLRHSL